MGLRALTFLASLAYFAAFRAYGFKLEDEGTILFHFAGVAAGRRPYLDFFTIYGPGFYHAGAALFSAAGEPGVRLGLAILNAATATGLYELARPFAGRGFALLAPLVWVALLPVEVGSFAAFNVPYPAWPCAAAWVALALALRAWLRGRSLSWLGVTGVLVAGTLAMKLNAGAYALVVAVWMVIATTRAESRLTAWGSRALAAAAGLGVAASFGAAVWSLDGAVLLGPALGALAVTAHSAGRALTGPQPRSRGPALLCLLAGVAVVTAAWMLPLVARLGAGEFSRTVLLLGTETLALYRVPYPLPDRATTAMLAAMGVGAVALTASRRRAFDSRLLLPILVGGAAAAGWALRASVMPEGFSSSLRFPLESAALWVVPAVHVAGLVWLGRLATPPVAPERAREALLVVACAIAMYWQTFPRTDFMHAAFCMPLSVVLGVAVFATWTTTRAAEHRDGVMPAEGRALRAVCALLAIAVAVVLMTPGLRAALTCRRDERAATPARLAFCLEPRASDDLDDLRGAAAYVRAATPSDARVLAFPALGMLVFAAERSSASFHDYWFPGKPTHDDERAMVEQLERDPPPLVANANDQLWVFADAPHYFAMLRRLVTDRYRLVARFGRYDVFGRADLVVPPPPDAAAHPAGERSDLLSPVAAYRRQAARRWFGRSPAADDASPGLPTDRRAAILFLRAIRDGGDIRATGWILAGLGADDPRIRSEAVRAAGEVAERLQATRFSWADDFPTAALRASLAPYRADAERLTARNDPEVRTFATQLLATIDAPAPAEHTRP